MIRPLDEAAAAAARDRQRRLLKPEGSLGRLEDLAVWAAAVTADPLPEVRAHVVVAAADHGVTAEAVSAYPRQVTAQMLGTFVAGGSAIAVLAREIGAEMTVVDAGVARDAGGGGGESGAAGPDGKRPRAIAVGGGEIVATGLRPSANLAEGPALTEGDVETALAAGRRIAAEVAAGGATFLVGGEMGIGNTTPATCLAAWLTGGGPELCGRGTGVDDAGLARKRAVVGRALSLHAPRDPRDALRCLGGGEIAVLAGLAIGAGEQGLGYVCDGVIATAAAAVAVGLEPGVRPRLLAGHRSPEPAHAALLDHLDLVPVVDLGLRLGEATGAAVAVSLLRLACALHRGMATFGEAAVAGSR